MHRELQLKPDHLFWTTERIWPRDPKNFLFLARAVNHFGKQKFKEEWDENVYWQPTYLAISSSFDCILNTKEFKIKIANFCWKYSVKLPNLELPEHLFPLDDSELLPFISDVTFTDEDTKALECAEAKFRLKHAQFEEIVFLIAGWIELARFV